VLKGDSLLEFVRRDRPHDHRADAGLDGRRSLRRGEVAIAHQQEGTDEAPDDADHEHRERPLQAWAACKLQQRHGVSLRARACLARDTATEARPSAAPAPAATPRVFQPPHSPCESGL
jgi:hypothetical protein